ncbi:GntR family transcriptional regulator [Streptomyces sp. NPDC059009]|uniref:GntR family transcriptional regulator n=1 Tax=Streptomyces sp. NPDC059009 TaxID=3346694 RepID=UPI00368A6334
MTKADFTPRYYQIEQALRLRIAGLRPHDLLPSDAELCAEFKVSRMTARSAVQRLVAAGLVYRVSGRGTFVAESLPHRRTESLVRFSEQMRRQGREPSSKVLTAALRPATDSEANRLFLLPPVDVVEISRIRLADGVPTARESAVFPPDLTSLLEADIANHSMHEALNDLGKIPTRGHSSIKADVAGAEEADLLAVPPGTALLVELRLILDQYDQPLELAESRYVSSRYALDVSFDVEALGPTQ